MAPILAYSLLKTIKSVQSNMGAMEKVLTIGIADITGFLLILD